MLNGRMSDDTLFMQITSKVNYDRQHIIYINKIILIYIFMLFELIYNLMIIFRRIFLS